ncbi:MAG TPA: acetyl-CoA carboxylase biotin carboxyl carrier protein [Parvularculaceae bacterium]|nr:acetyl-CoA carboxylase biotin carboxyl carrier protein [Caulobacterales bacterium]HOP19613.1 acetyl-CoA carboxylase biotin carboxyl carrier protein [Amphiplicatus sp.]HPE30797.1 acetyl-CoA carboxylase biotin carboxyl carrier protein [Parvularculaceae bacterium]HRX38445.1 acetyl-CoA carboxylase biotin carboxyl carrier protein [Parvularculaceae bacterium]
MAEKKHENKEIESSWIRELAAILHETGLTEIEIEKEDVRLRVSRAAAQAAPVAYAAAPVPAAPARVEEAPAAPAAKPANHPGAVPSPMVGTAYLAPSPGAAPFVQKGDKVREGQTLMIIEAMKTMNPIAAPRAGVVTEIFITDSQPVEFGETLAIIE